MNTYRLTYIVPMNLVVTVEANDEEEAEDLAWDEAQEYLQTVYGDGRYVYAEVDLDGIGADQISEVKS
jgi:hypothetical protein